ncbi:hypothetical protein LPW36_04805 [Jinshanibacter sp. LJY008]|uniref:Uncharacterized protein n=1 Tax=Limnobaculum eriocheiris TaxID=2897391 RepID=A0A9X1MVG9_9GAMM|nr:hypothetical protein [Limnobaculum eriocheiris]MCD1125350.1 hypothetical protein [Limnobaculum eriocheiris]
MTIKKSGNSRNGYPYAQNSGRDIPAMNDDGYLLALNRAGAWKEYTRRNNGNSLSTFAVQVCPNKRKALPLSIKNDAEFSRFMTRLGYIQIRTRKITGYKKSFWLYRSSGKELAADKGVCPQISSPCKAHSVVVQVSSIPQKAFKLVALDGKWLHVYDDHVCFLTKKRIRVDGKQVQGYTARGLTVEVMA